MSYVTYTALVALFLMTCVVIGLRDSARTDRWWVSAALAAAMTAAQFVLLVSQ